MKKLPLLAILLLTACTGPLGSIGRLVPDGSSGKLKGVHANVSMTGAGSLQIDEIEWIGTNGFPLPSPSTNGTQVLVPATVQPASLKLQ